MEDEAEDRLGMTEEKWEKFQAYTRGYGDQDENGVDLSLLRENLRLTPTERWEKMRRETNFLRAGRLKDQAHLLELEALRRLTQSG